MNLANRITILRIILIPVFMLAMLIEFPFHMEVSLALFILAAITDNIDGYIARKYKLITNFGKFIDPLADKLLITGALVILVQIDRIEAWIVFIILAREFAVTGLRSLAAAQDVIIAASNFGKIKTVSQIVAICILIVDNFPFSYINIPMNTISVYFALAMTVMSGVDYFYKNRGIVITQSKS
ncbi:MAG: CDP-diacylglycerol--glycerol-3-phosphate 3-phosphatidyltransferase [Bacillota bacterium]